MVVKHRVRQGDSIASVASEHGFFWETLWSSPDNAELKSQRNDPNVLQEGDVVVVPDLSRKDESCAVEGRHRFVRKGIPVNLRLRLFDIPESLEIDDDDTGGDPCEWEREDLLSSEPASDPAKQPKPRSNVKYTLEIESGPAISGKTSGDGLIECSVPPSAHRGTLVLEPGTPNEERIELRIGYLDPIDQATGSQARLNNLGFRCGRNDGEIGPKTEQAIKNFQRSTGLKASGELDEATLQKLREAHEST